MDASDGERLTNDQVDLLNRWLKGGTPWPSTTLSEEANLQARMKHWSFQPLSRPKIPALPLASKTSRINNPIDVFIQSRLMEENVEPSPVASRRDFIRRLSLDLLGLLPSPEEVESFQRDVAPNAYERLVDRYLASPQLGERWGRHWLDVVRFAESDGFETNQPRPNAWHYRDYVIDAFNSDKPYDQFLIEQIAGDLCGTDEATGFLVGGPFDRVKSPDPVLTSNQRADELHDMVGTTCTTFLGLTAGCARCHSHKFDPISQKDYYAIKAVFAGVQHGDRPLPTVEEKEKQRIALEAQQALAPIQAKLRELEPLTENRRVILVDDSSSSNFSMMKGAQGVESHATGTGRGESDQNPFAFGTPNLGKSYRWWEAQPAETIAFYQPKVDGKFRVWVSWGAGFDSHSQDARYSIDVDGDLTTTADQKEIASVDQRFLAGGEMPKVMSRRLWSGLLPIGVVDLKSESKLLLTNGEKSSSVTADVVLFEEWSEEDESTPLHLRQQVNSQLNRERFRPTKLKHLRFTVLATSGAEPCVDELQCFDSENQSIGTNAIATSSGVFPNNVNHKLEHINDGVLGNANSWISNEAGKGWVQLTWKDAVTLQEVRWSRDGTPTPQYRDRVATHYRIEGSLDGQQWHTIASHEDRVPADYPYPIPSFSIIDPQIAPDAIRLFEQESELRKKIEQVQQTRMAYAGRMTKPEPVYRLYRGDPMAPREEITAGALSQFQGDLKLAMDTGDPDRRMALARWMASADQPLTARVIVNRLWHYHFGTGIVDTPSDFGINGGKPSHPDLLNWLACELVDNQWSLKHVQRLILTSHTYRQASALRDGKVSASERLLWRYPPRRLEAESLRDTILTLSGSLRIEMGGPGFDLFEFNTNYVKVYDSKSEPGPDTWRRMVYQSKPRMQLDNVFGAFDCPDAGQVAPKRHRSTTPLQALSLLNSPFMLQQSQAFAVRLLRDAGPETKEQIVKAYQLAYSRNPEPDEAEAAIRFVGEQGMVPFCLAILNSNELVYIE